MKTFGEALDMKPFRVSSALVVIFVVLVILIGLFHFFLRSEESELITGVATAIATFSLVWVAEKQLQNLAKTADADFILKRSDKFFQPDTRVLLHLIEDSHLRFELSEPLGNSYFEIDKEKIANLHKKIQKRLLKKGVYSVYEIDDLILGPLEDIASLEKNKLISFDLIYEVFSWYICRVWQNLDIRIYITAARVEKEGAGDLYQSLESLAERCAARERRRP